MKSHSFPIAAWGIVSSVNDGAGQIEEVRIERCASGGFIIVTKEPSGTFDVWVESEAEVVELLGSMAIRWETGAR